MAKEQVEVTIDSNEAAQNPELTEVLIIHEDVADYEIEPLDEGDIAIQNCLFERKTPSDFASSISEGRLKDQVERMGGRKEKCFILVEGNMEDYEDLKKGAPAKSCRGMDASIEVRNNIPVKYCSNPQTLADMAVRLARKEVEEPVTVQARTTDTMKNPSFIENLFLGIEGIGWNKAERLAEAFPTLQDVYNADLSDFKGVKGIGATLAEEIYTTVHNDADDTQKRSEQSTKETESVDVISV